MVEEVGPGVDELQPGDHVILSWAPTCGRCHYCVIGRPNLCERRQPGRGVLPDGTTRMSLRGRAVYHYGHVATYASDRRARVVRDQDRSERAARPRGAHRLLGDDGRRRRHQHRRGAAGRQHRGVRRGRRRPQRGAGRRDRRRAPGHRGRRQGRQARARARAGRQPRVDASREDAVAAIRRLTGRGADYTFVAVGDTRAVTQAIEALAPGRHLRADRRAGDRRHGAAGRAAARDRRARDPRLQLRQRAHPRGSAAAGRPLPGRQAEDRPAHHASLRPRRGQRGLPRARRRRARRAA